MLLKTRIYGFLNKVYKTPHGLWVPDQEIDTVQLGNNVLAHLKGIEGRRLLTARNIVTDAGDIYYAQQGANETPTNDFSFFEMASAGTPAKGANRDSFTMIGSSLKTEASGYPQTNDQDANNTGAATDAVTHKVSYTAGDGVFSNISHGIITVTGATTGSPILAGWAFGSTFTKDGSTALDVFVNHTATGV